MKLWRRLVSLFRRPPSRALTPPVTPPEEHAEARARVARLEHDTAEVERTRRQVQAQLRGLGLMPRPKEKQ